MGMFLANNQRRREQAEKEKAEKAKQELERKSDNETLRRGRPPKTEEM